MVTTATEEEEMCEVKACSDGQVCTQLHEALGLSLGIT